MKFMKKKNLQQGEIIEYTPEVHWAKIVGPLLMFGLFFMCFLLEIYANASLRIPDFMVLTILAVLTLSFLLEILENLKIGFFITNKLLIILIFICPLLLYLHLARASVNYLFFAKEIIFNMQHILLTLTILSGVNLMLRIIEYVNEEYCITNRRLIIKRGVFSENITDIPIEKLEGMTLIQGVMGGVFKYGTIQIMGLGGSRPCLITVGKPYAVRRKIAMIMEKNNAITIVQEPYPRPAVKDTKTDEKYELPGYGRLITMYGPYKEPEDKKPEDKKPEPEK